MNKRLIIIIGVVVLVIASIGVLLFLAVRQQNAAKTAARTLQLRKLLDESVISPIASFDNNALWFFNTTGHLFRVNLDGTGLSEYPLPSTANTSFNRVQWPKTTSDFILVGAVSTGETKNYYNSTTKIYKTLSPNIKSFDYLPDSKRIVYIWQSGTAAPQLNMSNADGTGYKTIKEVFWPDLQVKASPDGKTVLMYRSNIEGNTNKIYSANLETGEISAVIDQGKNLEAMWLPDGNRFIYSQSGDDGLTYSKLFLYDFANKQSTDLKLITTLNKITLDSDGANIYAAVPKANNSTDVFIKENLSNFQQETYFTSDKVTATRLILLGGSLYFTNAQDQKFYSIGR